MVFLCNLNQIRFFRSVLTTMDSGVCELMSACGEGLGNELVSVSGMSSAVSGDDIQCQFCTKVSSSNRSHINIERKIADLGCQLAAKF